MFYLSPLIQLALTKASGKKNALTAKYRRWRRDAEREVREATEALETERIELTESWEKAKEEAATTKMKLVKEKELRGNIEAKQEKLHEEMRDYLLQLQVCRYTCVCVCVYACVCAYFPSVRPTARP